MKEFTIVWEDSNGRRDETYKPGIPLRQESTYSWIDSEYGADYERSFDEVEGGIKIARAEMYEAPPVKMAFLSALGHYFGTTDIHVMDDDEICQGGCETCDYSSMYGTFILVLNITQNYPA